MKQLLIFSVSLLLLVSCNKENTDPVRTYQIGSKSSGVINDPDELKSKFKPVFSENFAKEGRTVSFVRGKSVLNVGALEANELFLQPQSNTAARPNKGNWSGGGGTGGGGGGTSGGGGTTTITDYKAPRVMITMPTAGYVFDLKSLQYYAMNWRVIADDETKLVRVVVKIKGNVVKDTSGAYLEPLSTVDVWSVLTGIYTFPYGDGNYDMSAQAWDAQGNTTITSIVFSRNTQMTTLPTPLPTSYTIPHITDNTYLYQGGEGSCAAFSVSYAYSIERYNKENQTGGYNGNNVYSPEWIYNISLARSGNAGRCGAGSGILGNIGTVVNRGVPTWNVYPYSQNNGCDTSNFTDAIRANASLNKAIYGTYVPTLDRNLIKLRVTQNKVGIFAFQIDSKFMNAGSNYIWTFPHLYDGYLHSMVIVGYDDTKNAYLCLNSWGTSWASAGRIWVDYDFFEQYVSTTCWYFG